MKRIIVLAIGRNTVLNVLNKSSLLTLLLAGSLSTTSSSSSITQKGNRISIVAGILEKTICASDNNVSAESYIVDGEPLINSANCEISLRYSKAAPNRNPLELPRSHGVAVQVEDSTMDGTDMLDMQLDAECNNAVLEDAVQWNDVGLFYRENLERVL